VEKISGSTNPWHEIREGDAIALRAYNGKYVHIQNGTGPLTAISDTAGALETLKIEAVQFAPIRRRSPIPARLVVEAGSASSLEGVRNTVRNVLTTSVMPGTIKVEPLFPKAGPEDQELYKLPNFFLVTLPVRRDSLTNGTLHDTAYQLREKGNFEGVWPEGFFSNFYPPPQPGGTETPTQPPKDSPPTTPPPTTPGPVPIPTPTVPKSDLTASGADMGWSHRRTRIPQAWNLLPPGGRGAGVVIAQLDTGWTNHPELDCPTAFNCSLDLDRQFNTLELELDPPRWEDQRSAVDPITWLDWVHAHGTSTASVLISDGRVVPNQQPVPMLSGVLGGTEQPGGVVGVAPDATMIPIRCADSVILVSDVEVARAVHYAAVQNVDVITISMGATLYPSSNASSRTRYSRSKSFFAPLREIVGLLLFSPQATWTA
jgi:Subtilase family